MRIFYFMLLVCIMVSCAPQAAVMKASDDEILAERVNLYWRARQSNDRAALKELIDPELRDDYLRYLDSRKQRPDMSDITSFSIAQVKREGDSALVETNLNVKILYALLGAPHIIEQRLRNIWVKRDGSWYIELKKPDLADLLNKFSKDGKEVKGEMNNRKR